jgi:hypothetical protein
MHSCWSIVIFVLLTFVWNLIAFKILFRKRFRKRKKKKIKRDGLPVLGWARSRGPSLPPAAQHPCPPPARPSSPTGPTAHLSPPPLSHRPTAGPRLYLSERMGPLVSASCSSSFPPVAELDSWASPESSGFHRICLPRPPIKLLETSRISVFLSKPQEHALASFSATFGSRRSPMRSTAANQASRSLSARAKAKVSSRDPPPSSRARSLVIGGRKCEIAERRRAPRQHQWRRRAVPGLWRPATAWVSPSRISAVGSAIDG